MSVINSNILSLVAQGNLRESQNSLSTAIERLSSGLRINNAKDDAAGLAIANRFTSQIRGLTQASRNANDGISLAQTAEGSLDEINNNLQRIRELAVQAYNGTNSATDLTSINDEIKARLNEIERVADQTEFNGINILNVSGAAGDITIQVGADDNETITINANDAQLTNLLSGATSITSGGGLTLSGGTAVVSGALAEIDTAIQNVDGMRSDLGAIQNRFESAISNLNNTITNLSASRSRIQDADYAVEVSNMTRAQILQQAGTSVLAQANQVPQTVLSLLR